ncbi:MAG: LysE family translocator [Arcobacteraceae bacterium]
MELSTWLLYISVISLLIFSPGPSALLCVSDGLKYGNKKTIPTILGGAIAALVLMTVSAIGLGSILAASETLFFIIKIVGAFYLIYLGIKTWRDSDSHLCNDYSKQETSLNYSFYSLFQKGFMVGISNPKDLLFFIALFPSFMDVTLPQTQQYIILAITWFIIDCTSMFIYAGLGSKINPFISKANNINILNRTIGSVFVFLGGLLAFSAYMSKKS